MSLYALIHLRDRDVEAVFVFPDQTLAVSKGVEYARRSGFFHAGDHEAERLAIRELRDDHRLTSDVNDRDRLVIKRAFAVEGSAVKV